MFSAQIIDSNFRRKFSGARARLSIHHGAAFQDPWATHRKELPSSATLSCISRQSLRTLSGERSRADRQAHAPGTTRWYLERWGVAISAGAAFDMAGATCL